MTWSNIHTTKQLDPADQVRTARPVNPPETGRIEWGPTTGGSGIFGFVKNSLAFAIYDGGRTLKNVRSQTYYKIKYPLQIKLVAENVLAIEMATGRSEGPVEKYRANSLPL